MIILLIGLAVLVYFAIGVGVGGFVALGADDVEAPVKLEVLGGIVLLWPLFVAFWAWWVAVLLVISLLGSVARKLF